MSLYSDVETMLRRSATASNLQIETTLRKFKKDLRNRSEAEIYQSLPDRVKYNLCCTRIIKGDFSQWDGWVYRDPWAEAMRFGIKTIPFWDGSYTDDLVIIGEQGVGDEILFASIIPEAMIRCGKVTYACDERLLGLLQRSLRCEVKERYVDAREDLIGGHTAYIPSGDLLPLFRRRKGDFPRKSFIKINHDRVKEFEKYRGRIGISWRGRHGFINTKELEIENPLNIQYDWKQDEVEGIETPDIDLRDDLEGVFALISVLDKVVCVPTSVSHFAGSQGVRCEIILPRMEDQTDTQFDEIDWHVPLGTSPFYPNQHVYRNISEWKKAT